MNREEILDQLYNKQLRAASAYKLLYSSNKYRKPRRANFVKIKINIPKSRKLNTLLASIFLLPIPLVVFKALLSFAKKEAYSQFSREQILQIISIKGIKIDITAAEGEIIGIKTI